MLELSDIFIPTPLDNTDQNGDFGNRNFKTYDMFYIKSINEIEKDKPNLIMPSDLAVLQSSLLFDDYMYIVSKVKNKEYCRAYLRSSQKYFNENKISIIGSDGDTYCINPWETNLPHSLDIWTQVDMKLIFKLKELMPDLIKLRKDKHLYLHIGRFPQTLVNPLENALFEKDFKDGLKEDGMLIPTGKKYTLGYDKRNQKFKQYEEYVVKSQDNTNERKVIRIEKNNIYYWVEVEDICWRVMIDPSIPFDINAKDTDIDKCVLHSKYALNAGMPFYPNKDDVYNHLWQNSSPRAWLNGLNVNNLKSNGNPEFSAPNGGDYSKNNFLNEAFAEIIEKLKFIDLQKPENKQFKQRQVWGVEIREKPMTIDEQIKFYVENGKSFMLHGLSGVGKSRRVQELDPDLIRIELRNGMEPEEIKGKTIYRNNDKTQSGEWCPPYWFHLLCEKCAKEPEKKHIVFIDEITNVKPSVQSLVYHIVLEHTLDLELGKLPENAVVVAAGNSITESAAAFDMAEPLFRRFVGHVEIPLDIPNWLEWGSKFDAKKQHLNVHPLIANFVGTYGEKVFYTQYDPENPPKTAIDPRGWEQVSDIIYDNKGVLARELIQNKVGNEITASLLEFAQKAPITVQDVIAGNYTYSEIPTKFDAKYALALSLRYAKNDEVAIVRDFIQQRLGTEILKMYDSVWVGNDNEKALFLSGLMKGTTNQQNQGWGK